MGNVARLRLVETVAPKKSKAKKRTALTQYKTYLFVDKDPVIDELRTILRRREMTLKYLAETSSVSQNTIRNWFYGDTKRPQHAALQAVARAMGYTLRLAKDRR